MKCKLGASSVLFTPLKDTCCASRDISYIPMGEVYTSTTFALPILVLEPIIAGQLQNSRPKKLLYITENSGAIADTCENIDLT